MNKVIPNTHGLIIVNLVVVLLCLFIELDLNTHAYAWDVTAFNEGRWWVFVTGSFTHFNAIHAALNLMGLVVITALFKPKALELAMAIVLATFGVSAGMYVLGASSYIGLSGVLHALFCFYALRGVINGAIENKILLLGLLLKVGNETLFGVTDRAIWLIGGEVNTQAHLVALYLVVVGVIAKMTCFTFEIPTKAKEQYS
ncbi:rhombosortase [Enterovibrio norvegicus]|uniref:rhombosortase n=1 Tax=Enterovibrio norvegicus TaxID=188144 RepID=UPI000C83EB7E|nr:rhombosortase [Enterovibrio norvegicus]PMH64547.1 rhombosortase [Enterovibrio norvegicus]